MRATFPLPADLPELRCVIADPIAEKIIGSARVAVKLMGQPGYSP